MFVNLRIYLLLRHNAIDLTNYSFESRLGPCSILQSQVGLNSCLIEFPSSNKFSFEGKVSCDTKTIHYLDEITICIKLISASIKETHTWIFFSWSIYLLSNSWKIRGGASRCKYQNAYWWHLKHLSPVVPHSKPAMATKETKSSCSLHLITYHGNDKEENRCHSHRPRSPSEWGQQILQQLWRSPRSFYPTRRSEEACKIQENLFAQDITLEFFQRESGSCNNLKLKDIISNSSCICGVDVTDQSVYVSMHFLLQSTVTWGKLHKHTAFHLRKDGSITSTQRETHFVQQSLQECAS